MIEKRLAAVLVYDLERSTSRILANPAETQEKLRQVRDQIALPKVDTTRGNILKSTGDGAIVTFSTVHEAADLALELAEQSILPLRVSITLGDLEFRDNDIEPDEAIIAAERLQKATQPGTILVSQPVAEQLYRDYVVAEVGEKHLEGIGMMPTYSVAAGRSPHPQDRSIFRSAATANAQLHAQLSQCESNAHRTLHLLKVAEERSTNLERLLSITEALLGIETYLPKFEEALRRAVIDEQQLQGPEDPDYREFLDQFRDQVRKCRDWSEDLIDAIRKVDPDFGKAHEANFSNDPQTLLGQAKRLEVVVHEVKKKLHPEMRNLRSILEQNVSPPASA